jgi:uncharacterized membrane protein YhaH (DUF805 family)
MSFGEAISTCLGKYATFEGRASRSEFWWFYLFYIIVSAIGYVPALLIGVMAGNGDSGLVNALWVIFMLLWVVILIALVIPSLAVGCRRLHDRGQSGWLQLLLFVPCGNLILLVFWALEGTPGENAYGPVPST